MEKKRLWIYTIVFALGAGLIWVSLSLQDQNIRQPVGTVNIKPHTIYVSADQDHDCGHGKDPGFVCPTAKEPDHLPGQNAVLQKKCGGCQYLNANGGACPGKWR